jgi:hypothetical protein
MQIALQTELFIDSLYILQKFEVNKVHGAVGIHGMNGSSFELITVDV